MNIGDKVNCPKLDGNDGTVYLITNINVNNKVTIRETEGTNMKLTVPISWVVKAIPVVPTEDSAE